MHDLPKGQQLKMARGLAKESIRGTVTEEWIARRRYMHAARGGKLELPVEEIQSSVRAGIYARALTILDDIARNDPDPRWRVKAAEAILNVAVEEQRVHLELDKRHPVVEMPQQTAADATEGLTRDEKIAFVRAQLKLAGGT